MEGTIILNPTDHPVGTVFIQEQGGMCEERKITAWSPDGLALKLNGFTYSVWVKPSHVRVLEVFRPEHAATRDLRDATYTVLT